MYSKALSILDANTVELMVELEKRKAEEQDKELIYLRALLKEKGKPE